jgi:prevent-host-death family protein
MAESISVGVRELRNNFSHFLAEVKQGNKVTVLSHGKPVAELVQTPTPEEKPFKRTFGSLKGKMWIADDFDEPDEEMLAAMEADIFPPEGNE